MGGVHQQGEPSRSGTVSRNSSSRFAGQRWFEIADAGDVAARPVEARDQPLLNGVLRP